MDEDDDEMTVSAATVLHDRPVLKFGSLEKQARATHVTAESSLSPPSSSSSSDGVVISQAALTASMERGRAIAQSSPASSALAVAAESSASLMEAGKAAGHINIASASRRTRTACACRCTSSHSAPRLTTDPRPPLVCRVTGGEYYELSESAQAEQEKQAAILREMEVRTAPAIPAPPSTARAHSPRPGCALAHCASAQLRKRARGITIPTNDTLVRRRLRELGQPITLFGERQPGRRERLGTLLARLALEDGGAAPMAVEEKEQTSAPEKDKKAYLTPGPEQLKTARTAIAAFSLAAAQLRLQREKEAGTTARRYEVHPQLAHYGAVTSTLGDQRPVSACAFSPSGDVLATASWSGMCKLWAVPSCAESAVLRGHTFNATDVAWHPRAETSQSASSVNLASCGMDGQVLVWPLEAPPSDTDAQLSAAFLTPSSSSSSSPPLTPSIAPLASLTPHTDRCSRVAFHPSGDYLFSTSFDSTYAMHDVATMATIYAQPGHSYAVYSLSPHPDGSLLLTGDLGGVAHVWDLRLPRIALSLVGHARAVLCSDWAANGWTVCTGSDDNSVRVWDIRGKRCMYVLPAHRKLVSACKWWRGEWGAQGRERISEWLVTAGYDGLIKLWDGHAMTLVKELRGHERMVMRVSVQSWEPGRLPLLASAAFDRTWKLWHLPE